MARPKDPHARSALVAAARREFVVHGIQRARIEDLTHACGLSKGAFYLHFESKEALFRELVEALQQRFDELRLDREQAYRALIASGGGAADLGRSPGFMARVRALDAHADRRLLELLWDWRDVTDVLLRGCQGTEFEGVVWQLLDVEAARVRDECQVLQRVKLIREDVDGALVGLMIVGTYLLVARQLSRATARPDFEQLVERLQQVMSLGLSPRPARRRRASPTSRPSKHRGVTPP
jgi:AcrR family transcriptional regulator